MPLGIGDMVFAIVVRASIPDAFWDFHWRYREARQKHERDIREMLIPGPPPPEDGRVEIAMGPKPKAPIDARCADSGSRPGSEDLHGSPARDGAGLSTWKYGVTMPSLIGMVAAGLPVAPTWSDEGSAQGRDGPGAAAVSEPDRAPATAPVVAEKRMSSRDDAGPASKGAAMTDRRQFLELGAAAGGSVYTDSPGAPRPALDTRPGATTPRAAG